MNKTLLAVVGVILVAGVAAAVVFMRPPQEPSAPLMPDTVQEMPPDDPRVKLDGVAMEAEETDRDAIGTPDQPPVPPTRELTKEENDAMNRSMRGQYVPYDERLFSRAQGGDVVLFFRADWCPTCRALDADIRANLSAIPNGLVILDVDYDNSSDLKRKYGVTYQHTFVQVDANGDQIAKWSNSPTLAALVTQVK